jgi:hypothetical protein
MLDRRCWGRHKVDRNVVLCLRVHLNGPARSTLNDLAVNTTCKCRLRDRDNAILIHLFSIVPEI